MNLYCYHDKAAHKKLNDAGMDYTPAYLPIMLKNSGFSYLELLPEELPSLTTGDVLLIGAETLTFAQGTSLKMAIEQGCTVIAFATKAPDVFPEFTTRIRGEDIYDIAGYFRFSNSDEPLPVLGGFGVLDAKAGRPLGSLTDKNGNVYTTYVKPYNQVWYWSFDLPATIWHAADGHPTLEGQNGFPLGRISDGCVLGLDYDYSIAYIDSYMREIEEILSNAGFARLYPLPEHEGKISDIALYFAGDDDATSTEINLKAAANMRERGLPYHLNLMPIDEEGNFQLTKEQVQKLNAEGCETALHYNFLMFPYTEEGHRIQNEMYERAFGEPSEGPVNHCLIQIGSAAERYRIQAECGDLGDNNRLQAPTDPSNINAFNLTGFAFGSAFPRFVLCDAAHENRELKFCEVYSSYYEPRIYSGEPEEYQKIENYLDKGYYYGRPLQLFLHPHYISDVKQDAAPALAALDHAIGYVKQKEWNVWLCAPNAIMYWWHDRAKCSITNVTSEGFTVNNPTDYTINLVLPQGVDDITTNDMDSSPLYTKTLAGKPQKLVSIGKGQYRVCYLKKH